MARARLSVDEYLGALVHRRATDVVAIRAAILDTAEGVSEHVKWNAPSFCIDGDDRITFRLQPGDRVELVLHRGARSRDDVSSFSFDDPTGLITWSTPDRGVIAFPDGVAIDELLPQALALVTSWLDATRDRAR